MIQSCPLQCLCSGFTWVITSMSILSCNVSPTSVLSLTHVQRRRCWVMTAACTWRSSCRSPCTRRPRTWHCASCHSGRMACSWPPPPKSQQTPCDWSWTEAASSSPWTLVTRCDSLWMSLLTFPFPSLVSLSSLCILASCTAEHRRMVWHFEFYSIIFFSHCQIVGWGKSF